MNPSFLYQTVTGKKIGFFGITAPAEYEGIDILGGDSLYECAAKEAGELKKKGADTVIALAHLGAEGNDKGNSIDLYDKTEGIDFIIDGHSHELMTAGAKGELVQSAGEGFAYIGVIVLDSKGGIEDHYLISTEKIEPDENVQKAADRFKQHTSVSEISEDKVAASVNAAPEGDEADAASDDKDEAVVKEIEDITEAATETSVDEASADETSADDTVADNKSVKAETNKETTEKDAAEKTTADKSTADKSTADKSTTDKSTADKSTEKSTVKAETDKGTTSKDATEKTTADKSTADKSTTKADTNKGATEKEASEKTSSGKAADKASTNEATADKTAGKSTTRAVTNEGTTGTDAADNASVDNTAADNASAKAEKDKGSTGQGAIDNASVDAVATMASVETVPDKGLTGSYAAEKTSAEEKPAEKTAVGNTATENTATENTAAENAPTENIAAENTAEEKASVENETEGSQITLNEEGKYEVVKGDCLWKIAERHMGDGTRWTEIYELNKGIISNPSLIYVGQQLVLPPG